MATAINSPARAGGEIKLEPGVPQTFALKYITGKNVQGNYGPRVLFTAVDDRKLWLDAEDGSDIERAMRELNVRPADFITATWIKHPHGGGHSIRVELAEETRLEADLRKSIDMQRARTATPQKEAAVPEEARTAAVQYRSQKEEVDGKREPANAPQSNGGINPASAKMMSAMCAAVDAIIETQAYATRRGIGLTFSEESVRAIGLSIYIGAQREGRAA